MTGLTSIKMSFLGLKTYVRRFSIRFVLSDLLALKAMRDGAGELGDEAIQIELKKLRDLLNRDDLANEHRIPKCAADNKPSVDVFITFDEAHTLSGCYDKYTKETRFIGLRRVLNGLKDEPLFSFFLSTTGKISEFGQPRSRDPSTRIQGGGLTTPRPYIYLGFDQLMTNRKLFAVPKNTLTLKDVTSMEFAAHLGRPL